MKNNIKCPKCSNRARHQNGVGICVSRKCLAIFSTLALLGGCSLSPALLSCGTDGEASYVILENLKNNAPQVLKNYADLCGFNYDQEQS